MRILLLGLVFLSLTFASISRASAMEPVHYTLSPELVGSDLAALRVQVRFRADPSGTTDFRWGDGWNGEPRLWQWTRDLKVAGATAIEKSGDGRWRITAPPG